jgi:ApaG protein
VTKPHYEEVTRNIRVAVEPNFLEDQSEPEESRYLWSYHITIENKGAETVQLLSRYWRITDSRGRVREVRADGVIGEQPSGFMTGTYRMRAASGESFEIGIPMFALESPYEVRRVH